MQKLISLVQSGPTARVRLPSSVTNARLKRGESIARENSRGILVMKWKDKRDVILLSSKHSNKIVDTGKKTGILMLLGSQK